ncbi:hypothetical protein [Rugamonas sp.]|uniref:hypothetical protein n=1 Tax=Rugamonas sp. TaxID=1926287 RepID=UPI0025D2ECD9|nr:hypothetical protein [Rugamonas sp.]
MHIVIVAKKTLEIYASRLKDLVSKHPNHSAVFWTEQFYQDNEPTLTGKQSVIILGANEISKIYDHRLVESFNTYGTCCAYEGTKAVLKIAPIEMVSVDELNALEFAVDILLGKKSGPMGRNHSLPHFTTGARATDKRLIPWTSNKERKRKEQYVKLQHEYLCLRFVHYELDVFVSGAEI